MSNKVQIIEYNETSRLILWEVPPFYFDNIKSIRLTLFVKKQVLLRHTQYDIQELKCPSRNNWSGQYMHQFCFDISSVRHQPDRIIVEYLLRGERVYRTAVKKYLHFDARVGKLINAYGVRQIDISELSVGQHCTRTKKTVLIFKPQHPIASNNIKWSRIYYKEDISYYSRWEYLNQVSCHDTYSFKYSHCFDISHLANNQHYLVKIFFKTVDGNCYESSRFGSLCPMQCDGVSASSSPKLSTTKAMSTGTVLPATQSQFDINTCHMEEFKLALSNREQERAYICNFLFWQLKRQSTCDYKHVRIHKLKIYEFDGQLGKLVFEGNNFSNNFSCNTRYQNTTFDFYSVIPCCCFILDEDKFDKTQPYFPMLEVVFEDGNTLKYNITTAGYSQIGPNPDAFTWDNRGNYCEQKNDVQ